MPIGITTDICATFAGAIVGVLIGKKLPEYLKTALNNILGIAAITMGIVLIMRQHTLSAVVLSVILGCIVGEVIHLEALVNKGVTGIVGKLMSGTNADEAFLIQVSVVVILFCFGGTGWYGALNEGLTGDGSILITRTAYPMTGNSSRTTLVPSIGLPVATERIMPASLTALVRTALVLSPIRLL